MGRSSDSNAIGMGRTVAADLNVGPTMIAPLSRTRTRTAAHLVAAVAALLLLATVATLLATVAAAVTAEATAVASALALGSLVHTNAAA